MGESAGSGIENLQLAAAVPEAKAPANVESPVDRPADQHGREKIQKALEVAGKREREARLEFAGDARKRDMRQDSFLAVRVYAHRVRADRRPGDRVDFTETLFWNAGIATDERGQAKVSFALSDSVTAFRVLADAFSKDGALGSGNGVVRRSRPRPPVQC